MNVVLLCGGLSTRMGFDKSLHFVHNYPAYEFLGGIFENAGFEVTLSVNAIQQNFLKHSYSLIVDSEEKRVFGPLLGIYSAFQSFKKGIVLFCAVDLYNLNQLALDYFIKNFSAEYTINVFKHHFDGNEVYPLFFSIDLSKISASSFDNIFSVKYFLKTQDTNYIDLPEEMIVYFKNFNTQEDL